MTQRTLYSGLDLYDWRGSGPSGRTKVSDVDKWQQNQNDIRHFPGAFPVQSVVIADGQITPTAAAMTVDTEGGAPADDLTAIAPGDLHAGMLLALCSLDDSRKITIKNSAGASGIQTLDGKDITLDTRYAIMLRLVSTESLTLWREEPGPLRLQLTVSTPDTLGGVKVQTGDDDGLEMIGDKLRARQANATQRGSVLASTTAAAGAVPLGREDGSLDKSWTWEVGEYRVAHAESMDGGLLCHGAAVSRTTYNRLFSKIGTKFGEGNGKTTFNLPDFRNRTLWGAGDNLGAVIEAGLPGIYGTFGEGYLDANNMPATGAFGRKSGGPIRISGTDANSGVGTYTFDASKSSDKYGNSDTVQPPAIAVNVFIKY